MQTLSEQQRNQITKNAKRRCKFISYYNLLFTHINCQFLHILWIRGVI